jgi:hypothetical protein
MSLRHPLYTADGLVMRKTSALPFFLVLLEFRSRFHDAMDEQKV